MSSKRAQAYLGLSAMLKAGVPILRSVETATPRGRSRLRTGFLALAEGIRSGDGLAETMARHPKAFPPLDARLVDVAERAGRLPETLDLLAEHYSFRDHIRHIVTAGLALPVLLVHMAAFIAPLPPFVLGYVTTGQYLLKVAFWLCFLYVPATTIFIIVRFTPRTGPLRWLLDSLTLRIPILGRAVRYLALGRFARTFRMLYATGNIPIEDCVRQASDMTGNSIVRGWFTGGIESVRTGGPVSEGFSPKLPGEFLEPWRIGEESGKLDETTGRLADAASGRSEALFGEFARWLPRVIYFLVMILLIVMIFQTATRVFSFGLN